MSKQGFLSRHRNLLLIMLLSATLAVSSAANRRRLEEAQPTTALPVMQTTSAIAVYQEERAASYLTDIAALQAVSADASLDAATREAAADRLTQLVADREAEAALETALSQSDLAPCAAVVSGGSVTIVTGKAQITQADSALAMTLAAAHAGISAEDVRIITSLP